MGNNNRWLKSRKRHQVLIAKIKRIAGGSFIAALIVGPLVYFSVVAMPLEMRDNARKASEQALHDMAATPEIDVAATQEVRISTNPIPKPKAEQKETKILLKSKKKDLKLEPEKSSFAIEKSKEIISMTRKIQPEDEQKFESFFDNQNAQMKNIIFQEKQILDTDIEKSQGEESILIVENVTLSDGPEQINNNSDANNVAEKTLQRFLRSELPFTDFRIYDDTKIIGKNKKPYQFVLSTTKQNANKWYVTFRQYKDGLPVFDGNIKLIFSTEKKLLTISDNIKRELPPESEFVVGKAVVKENVKKLYEWDQAIDEITFIDQGYYKNKPAYRATAVAHDPLGEWEIFVNGVDGTIYNMTSDIRLADAGATPEVDSSATPEVDSSATPQATAEPDIEILENMFSQIVGTIYPKTPNDELATEPFAHIYAYIDDLQHETDAQGYFENPDMQWYSTFLEGPYVTIHDDDATSNMEIINQTPENPFVWDENSASLAAINAFYHTNKIHDYFADKFGYEIGKNIPLTVNSVLVDAYMDGCGAWFNNTEKTIEMGRGGTTSCPAELNYALGSDLVYHEYTHFMVEDVTHLPYILGSESAAMSEGLSDYFASTINNDPVWGDVIAPSRRRNLENTLNYNTDMNGEPHHDGMIFSGALWDLRKEIGAEATDELVFNTLFQDRYHFETFMYGMIIEDDDNNDFSDGTPHLAEIITAFDNHGIGPGIENFDGLPLTPEAWAELLDEEPPEGEEEELLGAYVGPGCNVSGSNLTVEGGLCAIYYSQTFYDVTVNSGGTLQIGYPGYGDTSYNILTIEDDLVINDGGNVYVGRADTVYGSRILFSNVSGTPYIYNYGNLIVQYHSTQSNYIGYSSSNQPRYYGYSTGTLSIWDNATSNFQYASVNGGAVNVGGVQTVINPFPNPPSYINRDGYLNVQGYAYFHNGATLNVGNSSSNVSTFYNDRLYLSYASTYTASTVTNYGRIYVDGNFEIDNGSTLTNYYRFQQSSGYTAIITGNSTITNTSTNSTYMFDLNSPATMSVNGTTVNNNSGAYIHFDGGLTMNNDTILNNTGGGSVYTGNLTLNSGSYIDLDSGLLSTSGAIDLNNTSYIDNAKTLSTTGNFTVDSTINPALDIAGTGSVTIGGDFDTNTIQTITNPSGHTMSVGGALKLYNGSSLTNNGVLTTHDMYCGEIANTVTTTCTNSSTGNFDASGSLWVYSGSMTIDDGGDFDVVGNVIMEGDPGTGYPLYWATLTNNVSGATIGGSVYLNGYGTIKQLEASPVGTALAIGGSVIMESASDYLNGVSNYRTISIGNDLDMRNNNCAYTNYAGATTTVYNKVLMGTSTTSDATLTNSGTFNITGSTANELKLSSNAYVENLSTASGSASFNVDKSGDGMVSIFGSASIDNSGTSTYQANFETYAIKVGDPGNPPLVPPIAGGTFNNKAYGYFKAYYSGENAVRIYMGEILHQINAIDFISNGFIKISGSSGAGNQGRFGAFEDGTSNGIIIEGYGLFETANTTTWTNSTNDIVVYDASGQDYTSDGELEINFNGTLNNTDNAIKVGANLTTKFGGALDNSGTINTKTLHIYDSGDPVSLSSYDNVLNRSTGIMNVEELEIHAKNTDAGVAANKRRLINDGSITVENSISVSRDYTIADDLSSINNNSGGSINLNGLGTSPSCKISGGSINNYEDISISTETELYNEGFISNIGNFSTEKLTNGNAASLINGGHIYNGYSVDSGSGSEYFWGTFNVTDTSAGAASMYAGDGRTNGGIFTNYHGELNVAGGFEMQGHDPIDHAEFNNEHHGGIKSTADFGIDLRLNDYAEFNNDGVVTSTASGVGTVGTVAGSSGTKRFYNLSGGTVTAEYLEFNEKGYFYNNDDSDLDINQSLSLCEETSYLENKSTVEAGFLIIGDTTTGCKAGGTFNNTNGTTSNGSVEVVASSDSQVDGGTFTQNSSGTVNIVDDIIIWGPDNVGYPGTFDHKAGAGKVTVGGLTYIRSNGKYLITGTTSDAGLQTSTLEIAGNSSYDGLMQINGSKVYVANSSDSAVSIQNYGILENNAYGAAVSLQNAGFSSAGKVTVSSEGTIISDDYSSFFINEGLTSAGTVEIDDNFLAYKNTTTGYAIEVTDGTITFGLPTNTGAAYAVTGNVHVSGGDQGTDIYNFTSYDIFGIADGNLTVTGTGTKARLEDSQSPAACKSAIVGDLFIYDDAELTVNCTTTSDPALDVYSNSPGGHTQVEGTLILNTNMETETMTVGDGGLNNGLVTHDAVDNTWDPTATFVLAVTENLTVNSNGEMNVSEKSSLRQTAPTPEPFLDNEGRGGTYGGRGQYDYTEGSNDAPFGNIDNWLVDFGRIGVGSQNCTVFGSALVCPGGNGGGIMNITVGEDLDSDGFMDTGIFIIESNGLLASNGADFADGAGSGGSINIKTRTLQGGGEIMAAGGDASSSAYDKTAGGGGRIYVEYYDKSNYTGKVGAPGGINTDSVKAGTGTIFYLWKDKWQNQNDGTLVIDGFSTSDDIDVDLDGNTVSTDTDDATEPVANLDIESVQVDRYAGFYIKRAGPTLATQQCIEANSGTMHIYGTNVQYNRDHGPSNSIYCLETPDPPADLLINNSTLGADAINGLEGDKFAFKLDYTDLTTEFNVGSELTGAVSSHTGTIQADNNSGTAGTLSLSEISGLFQNDESIQDDGANPGKATTDGTVTGPLVSDLTPAISAIYKEGALDRTGAVGSTTHRTYEYQLLIGNTLDNVWNDISVTNCNIDSTAFSDSNRYSHNERVDDIIIPSSCGANLSINQPFYWKIRFLEDIDDDYGTTGDQYWGLWSETNQFYITDGGQIVVGDCPDGAGIVQLNLDVGAVTPVHFDNGYCGISVDTTTDFNISTYKNQTLTDSTSGETFPDMLTTDTFLDGYKDFSTTQVAEFAFRLDNFTGTTTNMIATTDVNQGASKTYDENTCDASGGVGTDPCWHELQTGTDTTLSNNTIITSAANAIAEKFKYHLGAYIPFPADDEENTAAGKFESSIYLTLWSNP